MTKEGTTSKVKKESKLSKYYSYNSLNKYEGLRGKLECRAPTTFVGVEIELEEVHHLYDQMPTSFTYVGDGSLKLRGKEFVTIPIRFCYLEQEIKRLFASIKTPHISTRCSIHVHLNARDFTHQELYRFLLLYLIFERHLFKFSGGRSHNIFCTPLFSYMDSVTKHINLLLKEGGVKYMQWSKYYALNLAPIWGQEEESKRSGTIEFRHMAGTTDVEHIIEWINLIVSLKISAKKFNTEELIENINTMNSTSSYNRLATEVFKKWHTYITDQPTFKEDVEQGVLNVKESFCNDEKVEITIPLTNKEYQ